MIGREGNWRGKRWEEGRRRMEYGRGGVGRREEGERRELEGVEMGRGKTKDGVGKKTGGAAG
jgi:hypothetical protein